jgi:hypothetical protein
MKFIISLYIVALLPSFSLADTGFDIGRPKAPCYAVFTGIEKLSDVVLFISGNKSGKLKTNDTIPLYYSEEEKWRQGPLKIIVQNKKTQQNIDSVILTAEGYNLTINFTGVENNKVKYTVDKSKAVYPYQLFPGDNTRDPSVARQDKFILAALSLIGFLAMAFFFYKRRNPGIPLKDS